ncbi:MULTISPECIES: L-tyrosine/L-tryptophan isonitrile synthase family protein [Pseudomonas]|uniref:Isocyanide synthase family protein n=1 Tax=Pseudomonas tritici TaxID=2745518 RepID=A0A8H9YUW5_9PSED|nr:MULTISPECIES: isocyanide synthase family protein [Pseudomonas]MBP2874190.1 isocyanide synthase family protein [Pseudomonas sp. SWRI144]QXH85901.1 isocyanide synthase family protein [Pseudomonas tritici]CRM00196.1 Pyoverdine/dityrosine biosynthesis protein [Pseudomonas sp. 24 E 1]CRM07801.1 Pyoverdine/dityrosine biosynthesis protein [Pseudomonas sp. 35 E 8]CRM27497.1 Pyoverdine/dityrosine biosynthesis protein [Pseudomonas sp. 24 R 17]
MHNMPSDTSSIILNEILRIRRRDERASLPIALDEEADQIHSIQIPRIQRFVEAGRPIELVLPAFPAKSPNPDKVIGRLPDLAERISLQSLDKLCTDIKSHYAPGARLTICSDGRVFSDVIGVDDEDVSRYQSAIGHIIAQKHAHHLRLYNLEDCTRLNALTDDFDQLRRLLIEGYAEPLTTVKKTLMKTPEGVELYRAITRFMFEDNLIPGYSGSRSALQKKAKLLSVEVIQRSWAWGELLAQEFPNAIRLSIHPQPVSSLKIGIHMMPAQDSWITPWHGVAVGMGDDFKLMNRKDAQRCGAHLIMQDDLRSHYAIDSSQTTSLLAAAV